MLNAKQVNRYFLRVSKMPVRSDIVGQVVYLKGVSQKGIAISLTEDCRPKTEVIRLPASLNDNGWYDVTDLVLDANCSISPRYDLCTFLSDTASLYRHHLDDPSCIRPLTGKSAVGHLCFLGKIKDGQLVFSNTAYFVVSVDTHGFYITYAGFCKPIDNQDTPMLQQKVLRLEGTGQQFYSANEIVNACNSSYSSDIELKNKYMEELESKVTSTPTPENLSKITGKEVSGTTRSGNLSGLHLADE